MLKKLLGISFVAFCLPALAQVAQPQTGSIAIDAYNGLAVAAERSGLVQLFNVKNPQSPAFLSKIFVPDQLNGVALAGHYVLAAGQNGVHIVDISNPKYPAIGNTVPLKTEAVAVKAAGNLGYAAFGSALALFDIPSGTLLDQRDYSTLPVNDLALAGDAVYVLAAASSGAASYVVTKVAIQSYLDAALASFQSPSRQQASVGRMSIYAGDNFVYIGGAPAAIGETGGLEILRDNGATFSSVGAASAIDASVARPSGSGLLVFSSAPNPSANGQLGLLDISDPAMTSKLLKPLSAAGVVYDFLLYAGQAYVADGSNAFQADSFAAPTGQKAAPSLTLSTNFAAGTAVESSLMRLTASVTGGDQIRSVDFYVNDMKVATDGNYPFEYRFVTPDLSMEASLTLYACAQDIDGNRSCSAPTKVDLEKDKTPLRVLAVTPEEGSHAARGGISTLTARFNRPLDVSTVALTNVTLVKSSGSKATPVKLAGVTFQPLVNMVSMQTAAPIASGSYTAALAAGIKSSSGMPLSGGKVWHFTSGGTATWVAAASGNWSVGANWAAGVPPQAGDAVTIAVPDVTVTLNSGTPSISTLTLGAGSQLSITAGSLTIASASTLSGTLSLAGGTLAATGGVTINSAMNWTGGTVSGVVNVGSKATLAAAIGYYGLYLSAGTINNSGTATLNESSAQNGFQFSQGGVVNNLAGATWTIQSDSLVAPGDSSAVAFRNTGSFVKSGTATTTWNVPISGSGPISVASGTLTLNGSSAGTIKGTINVGTGATLNYGQGGTLAGAQVTGGGTFVFTANTEVNGTYRFAGPTQISGGTVDFNGATAIGNLSLAGTGATMAGPGVVTVSSLMTWTNGTVSDVLNIAKTAKLAATIGYWGLYLAAGVINNAGAVTLNENSAHDGLQFSQGGVVNNLAGASWAIQSDSYVAPGDGSAVAFNNTGSFLKSGGTSTTTWNVPISGAGPISVASGSLTLNGNSTGTITGPISVGTGATLNYGQGGTLAGAQVTGSGTFIFTANTEVNGAYSFAGPTQITSGTVDFNAATTIANLTLAGTGAAMAGPGAVTVSSLMTWTSGTVSDVLNIAKTAKLSATVGYFGLYLAAGVINNAGAVTLNENSAHDGLQFSQSGVVNNLAGATWTIQSDSYVAPGDTSPVAFNNAGSLLKSGGTGTTTWNVPISGAGPISVTSGTLTLDGNLAGAITGTINVGTSATLNYGQGGTLAGAQVTGSGTFIFTASTEVNGAYNFTGPTQITSGTVDFNAATTIANLTLAGTGAAMAGPGAVTVSSLMTWTSGTVSDVLNIAKTAKLSATVGYFGLYLAAGVINNAGAVTLNENSAHDGLQFSQSGVVNNLAGATWTIQSDSYVAPGDTSPVAFNNAGSLLKSGGTGTTTWNVPISGAGPISVTSGTLTLDGNSTGTITGTITVGSGATLNYGQGGALAGGTVTGGGTFIFTASTEVNGTYGFAGLTQITSGTVDFNGTTTIANLRLAGTSAAMAGPGVVTISSVMNWTNGAVSDVLNIDKAAQLSATVGYWGLYLAAGVINNAGAVMLNENSAHDGLQFSQGGLVNNLAGATWTIQSDVTVAAADSTPVAFNNAGSLNKSGGTNTSLWSIPLNNTGTINLSIGSLNLNGNYPETTLSGTINIAAAAVLNYAQQGTLTNGQATGAGMFNFTTSNSNGTNSITGTYKLSVPAQILGGTLNVKATGTLNASTLMLTNATLQVDGTTSIGNLSVSASGSSSGGAVTGVGSITVSDTLTWNQGSVSLTGTFNVQNMTFSPNSALSFKLGTSALSITAKLTLNGTLTLTPTSSNPAVGTAFKILNFVNNYAGDFLNFNIPVVGTNDYLKESLSATGLSFTVTQDPSS